MKIQEVLLFNSMCMRESYITKMYENRMSQLGVLSVMDCKCGFMII